MNLEWNAFRTTGERGGTKSIRLTSSSTSLEYSRRYGYSNSTTNIVLTVSLVGINAGEYVIAWQAKDDLGADVELISDQNYDIIKELDVSSLSDTLKSIIVTATVTSRSVVYTSSVTLDKAFIDDKITKHLGILTTYPNDDLDGGKLIEGDSFVLKELVDEKYVFTPYVYTNNAWSTISDTNNNVKPEYFNILQQSATSIFENGEGIDESSVAIWGYFKNLVATNAFVQNMATQNLNVGDFPKEIDAVRFSGNTYAQGSGSALNVGTGDFAVSMWFKINEFISFEEFTQIFCKRINGGLNSLEIQIENSSQKLKIYSIGSTGVTRLFNSNLTLVSDQWYNISVIKQSDVIFLYINGFYDSSYDGYSYNIDSAADIFIGCDVLGIEFFKGDIREISIYQRTLTDDEILNIYNGNAPTPDYLWKMNEGLGHLLNDTYDNYSLTLYNELWVTEEKLQGFRFRARAYDKNGNKLITPLFDVYYHEKVVFSINAATGNINFGDDGSGNPLFYYEQSSKSIKSKNEKFIIDNNGNLTADTISITNGIFSGLMQSVDGLFKGQFETAVLKTLSGVKNSESLLAPQSNYQAGEIYDVMENSIYGFDSGYYKCEVVEYPDIKYVTKYYGTGNFGYWFKWITFYNSNRSQLYKIETDSRGSGVFLPNTLNVTIYKGGDELYMIDLPVSKPSEDNRVWNDNGTLKIT